LRASLESAARDVVSIYPVVKDELEALFGWQLDVMPRVVLIKNSRSFQQMTRHALSVDELEEHWRTHLKAGPSWLVYLADHIYGIVFFPAAVITIAGFIRRVLRKRAYSDDEDEN
jgi:hypothetical protein